MIHPVAWVVWLGATLVILSATRNPFYLGLVLLWVGVVKQTTPYQSDTPPIPLSPLRFGIILILLSGLFNALTVHIGSYKLFYLPTGWPLIGGAITLEALVYGMLNGLVLAGMFATFVLFNLVVSRRALVRLIPRAFHPLAVVTAIAISFVPTTLRQFKQIREAQAIRGHQLRGWRDWLPLLLPLLISSLEYALQLAEAMVARGFASQRAERYDNAIRLSLITGLIAVVGGWLLRLVWGASAWGAGFLLAGIIILGITLRVVGRRVPHTVYRPAPWQAQDWLVMTLATGMSLIFLMDLPGFNRAVIFYYPYPRLTPPEFDLPLALATCGLLGPFFYAVWSKIR